MRPIGQSRALTRGLGLPPFPVVLSIAPNVGTVAGGTAVTITGNNFLTATSAAVGGVNIGAFHVVDDHHITGTTGAHAAGASSVTVTSPSGTSAPLVGAFTYGDPPQVLSIAPPTGSTAGGTPVTITGNHFLTALTASVGLPLVGAVVVDDHHITGTTDVHAAGAANVDVTNPYGARSLVGGYTYVAPFNPATLNLTLWQRGPAAPLVLAADTWVGTASAGLSGANRGEALSTVLVAAGTIPNGPTVDGRASDNYASANDGGAGNRTIASLLADATTHSAFDSTAVLSQIAYTMWVLARVTIAQPADPTVYQRATFANVDARWGFYFTAAPPRVGVYHFDGGGFPAVQEVAPALGTWFFAMVRFAATTAQVDVNNVPGTPAALANIAALAGVPLKFGGGAFNYATSQPNAFDILEAGCAQSALSDADRDGIYADLKARYPSLGLP